MGAIVWETGKRGGDRRPCPSSFSRLTIEEVQAAETLLPLLRTLGVDLLDKETARVRRKDARRPGVSF